MSNEKAISHLISVLDEAIRPHGDLADLISYVDEHDEIGHRTCCHAISYRDHEDDCVIIKLRAALAEVKA